MSAALIVGLAQAGPLVIHGDRAPTGLDLDDPRLIHIGTMLEQAQPLVLEGNATFPGCDGEALTTTHIADALKLGRRALAYMQFDRAAEETDPGRLLCLDSGVDPSMAAQLAFVHGVVSFELGLDVVTKQSFALTVALDPSLVWDEGLPPNARPLFEQARSTSPTIPVTLLGNASIDGQTKNMVRPGRHLVHTQTKDMWVDIDEATTIVVPSGLDPTMLEWTQGPHQAHLAQILDAWAPPTQDRLVWHDGALWRFDQEKWQPMTEHKANNRVPWLVAGGATGAAGALMLSLSLANMQQARQDAADASGKDLDAYNEAVDDYRSATIGSFVSGGMLVLGTGVVWRGGVSPTGAHVTLRW